MNGEAVFVDLLDKLPKDAAQKLAELFFSGKGLKITSEFPKHILQSFSPKIRETAEEKLSSSPNLDTRLLKTLLGDSHHKDSKLSMLMIVIRTKTQKILCFLITILNLNCLLFLDITANTTNPK